MSSFPEAPAFPPAQTHVSWRRFFANWIDGIVYGFLFGVFLVPVALASDVAIVVYVVLGLTVGQVAYFVLTQRRDGQTPGKRITGVRVVDAQGRVPPQGALVKRSVPLIFEYFLVLAFISMQTSEYRQRLGDRWAGTFVVAEPTRAVEAGAGKPQRQDGDAVEITCRACGAKLEPGTTVCPHCGRIELSA